MNDESNALGGRPSTSRSKVTNGSALLRGVDGRSARMRRFRDLCELLAADASGAGELTFAGQESIKQAAALLLEAEAFQTAIVNGDPIDHEQLTRVTNSLVRLLKILGVRKGDRAAIVPMRDRLRKVQ
jgi:hypothetical protein